jgi:GDP/UDP-N,N'-diacetylbacillosamine 2-epimerase (hydrolysing)
VNIHYVSGSRADFGLMSMTLRHLDSHPGWSVGVVLAGQALDPHYGDVEAEVAAAGLTVAARVPARLSGDDAREMALAFAAEVEGLTAVWSERRPDLVMLLGDRGEMLAAAIVAFHLEIPTAHLHGGERSGTLDDGFRHAISKLATWHFPATAESAARLERMGENPDCIVKIGAPGLVELSKLGDTPAHWLANRFPGTHGRRTALFLFHPVVQEADRAESQACAILTVLGAEGFHVIALRPNSDAGGRTIARELDRWQANGGDGVVLHHLGREDFLRTLQSVDVLVGNSSSGIVESASLGTPCLNLGSRQDGRERNGNIVDCPAFSIEEIRKGLAKAVQLAGPFANVYGDGHADERLEQALASLSLGGRAPGKRNMY